MKYKIFIIEDSKRTYEKISAKIDPTSFEFVGFLVEETTNFTDYITILVSQPADIYIVDWKLVFSDRVYTPQEIFKELSKTNFDFLSKYWIFYSGPEGNQVAEFLRDYFPNKSYYDTPGKGNIEGAITKSGKDHFKDAIQDAVKFLDTKQVPQEIKDMELSNVKTTIRDFIGAYYDIDDLNEPYTIGKNVLILNNDLFICMSYADRRGIFLYFDDIDRRLKKLLFRFNNSGRELKDQLGRYAIESGRNFVYNSTFFDNSGVLKNYLGSYIQNELENLKLVYEIEEGKYTKYKFNLNTHTLVFKNHGININL